MAILNKRLEMLHLLNDVSTYQVFDNNFDVHNKNQALKFKIQSFANFI